jgi:plasmid maintenance system antidote protein VapI
MLLNLKTEIIRKHLSEAKIAAAIKINPKTMSNKVTEKSDFTRSEMYKIAEFFPDTDMKYLFASDKGE